MMKSAIPGLTYTALVAVVIFWGLSFVATKIALETFPTFTLIFIRFSLAAFFFCGLMLTRGFPRFSRRDHIRVFLMSLFEPGLYFIFETMGLQYTSAPKTALIIATIPVAVLVFAFLFINERPAVTSVVGIGLSLIGIGILVVGDPNFSWQFGGSLLGDLLIIGAVITAALYMVYARRLGKGHAALDITGFQMMYGALLYAPLFFWELPAVQWSVISSRSVAALAYLTLFATCAAFLFYNYALTKLPAGKASVFVNGIPVVTAVAAWLLLGETLTLLQLCGGLLVLAAVCLTNLPGWKARRRVAADFA
jgi:drug/metabolite transporter (DMT)-like permease